MRTSYSYVVDGGIDIEFDEFMFATIERLGGEVEGTGYGFGARDVDLNLPRAAHKEFLVELRNEAQRRGIKLI